MTKIYAGISRFLVFVPFLIPVFAGADAMDVQIARFQEAEAGNPPQGQVLFLGSSTFDQWDVTNAGETETELDKDFAEFANVGTMARALSGSIIQETTDHIPDLVTRYHPRAIVFYAGENDIKSEGASAQEVLDDFTEFVGKVHSQPGLAQVPITYVSIKPSPWLFSLM